MLLKLLGKKIGMIIHSFRYLGTYPVRIYNVKKVNCRQTVSKFNLNINRDERISKKSLSKRKPIIFIYRKIILETAPK